jgi:hypothetical protein
MKKTFAAFAAVATIAGSLAATPTSAQRGVAAGVAAPGYYHGPGAITDQVAGVTTILVVANRCNSVSGTAMAGGSAGCESAADCPQFILLASSSLAEV